jgi:C4-type Zn-finger protein
MQEMELNYYYKDRLGKLEVFIPCPGCGRIDHLAVHWEQIGYLKNKIRYWIGCSCGWKGPDADHPDLASEAWEIRQ